MFIYLFHLLPISSGTFLYLYVYGSATFLFSIWTWFGAVVWSIFNIVNCSVRSAAFHCLRWTTWSGNKVAAESCSIHCDVDDKRDGISGPLDRELER